MTTIGGVAIAVVVATVTMIIMSCYLHEFEYGSRGDSGDDGCNELNSDNNSKLPS